MNAEWYDRCLSWNLMSLCLKSISGFVLCYGNKNALSAPIVRQWGYLKCHRMTFPWINQELDIMRLRHTEVNFEATYNDHQNTSECSWNMILSSLFDLHHVRSKFTSWSLNLMMSSFFFMHLLHSAIFWLFDIWQIIGNSLEYGFCECIQWITELITLVNVQLHPTTPTPITGSLWKSPAPQISQKYSPLLLVCPDKIVDYFTTTLLVFKTVPLDRSSNHSHTIARLYTYSYNHNVRIPLSINKYPPVIQPHLLSTISHTPRR